MYITPEEIYNATNGGLDIILAYFPQAHEASTKKNVKFKMRGNEKTASAALKEIKGIWYVTDFGGDSKGKHAITLVQEQENCDFKEALQIIANRFNIIPATYTPDILLPNISKRDATAQEEEGNWFFEVKDFTELELRELFAKNVIENNANDFNKLAAHCQKYKLYSLAKYTIIKNRQAIEIHSTDRYPIFMWDFESFKKVYQPKSLDKSRRFIYYGGRKQDFIFGYSQCLAYYNELNKENKDEFEEDNDNDGTEGRIKLIPEVIMCSGERDALNISALGYQVICLNSETAKLTTIQFLNIKKISEGFYNLPDIDATGLREGHAVAMQWLEIKTIWLPEELKTKRDFRGNPCKDVRDYLNHYTAKQFKTLVEMAMPYKFWDEKITVDKKGKSVNKAYDINNVYTYNFLNRNGFFRFKTEKEKEGYIYVQIVGNVVHELKAQDVKAYISKFLKERNMHVELRNAVFRTNQLNENSLANIDDVTIDFSDCDKHTQYLFFNNKTWQVTANEILEYKVGDVNRMVWQRELIPHRVSLSPEPFKIIFIEDKGIYDIDILNTNCHYFKYLINASRIHWRTELEEKLKELPQDDQQAYFDKHHYNIAGPLLEEEAQREQKTHLVNKIFSIGYLLHRYKDPSKPWCVFAMDNKISEEGESHGGSGKSTCYKALWHLMSYFNIDGRNQRVTENPHIYDGLTEHTDMVLIDDSHQYLDFNFFFSPLTGELTVNPKNNKQYTIAFKDVPKFVITSNHTLRHIDPSTERRILYTVFSDYYHQNSNGEYNETRTIKDDIGKNLFMEEFTVEDWNNFFNTMAYCLKFYISCTEKVEPPLDNVTKRNLLSIMGLSFKNWADVYFNEESNRLNQYVSRKSITDAFFADTNENKTIWKPQRISKALRAWCQYNGYVLDPKELCNKQGRIIKSELGTTIEMFFIKTQNELANNLPF